jgi:hypothetical protein
VTTLDERPDLDLPHYPPDISDRWAALQAPFDPDEIELLPKPTKKENPAGPCTKPDRNGLTCGGWHGLPAVHLSYVGHAGITMRLNEVAGPDGWSWEPAYRDVDGELLAAAIASGNPAMVDVVMRNAPARFTEGGLWIRLTIMGETRLGFGDAAGKSGTNAVKEIIGDAIRNAAMRFGVGTYLWSKSDRAAAMAEGWDDDDTEPIGAGAAPKAAVKRRRAPASKPGRPQRAGTARDDAQAEQDEAQARTVPASARPAERVQAGAVPPDEFAARPPAKVLAGVVADAVKASTFEALSEVQARVNEVRLGRDDVAQLLTPGVGQLLGLDLSQPVRCTEFMLAARRHIQQDSTSVHDAAVAGGYE